MRRSKSCENGTDLSCSRQRCITAIADALALHATAAEGAMGRVGGVVVAEHALAHAAEVALHGVLHVAQVVPPKAPVAASLPALPPVYPCRCLRNVIVCRQNMLMPGTLLELSNF